MDEGARIELMRRGREAFNRGEFYEAHEFWEEVWDELDDPERRWVQGLIQVATGLHKLARLRPDVCVTLLVKALGKLDGAPVAWGGVDVAAARRGAEEVLASLRSGGRPDPRALQLGERA
jgi:predicted metal-dependent hydrolase